MKKTGDFLKKIREEKGLSIHEIGLSLKINPKILKQIEEGDRDNLPAKTFLRGFVQSYAQFLKVDPNEVLKIFSEEMGTTKPNQISLNSGPQIAGSSIDIQDTENKEDTATKRNPGKNFSKDEFEFKNIGIGVVVFVLLLSLFAARKVMEKYQREAEVDVAKSEESLKSNTKLEMPQAPQPVTLPQAAETKPASASANPLTDVKPQASSPPASAATQNSPGQPAAPSIPNTALPANRPAVPQPPPATSATTAVAPAPKPAVSAPPVTVNPARPTPPPATEPPPAATASTPAPTAPATTTLTTTPTPQPKPVEKPAEKPAEKPSNTVQAPATPPKEEPKKPKNIELVIEAYETVEIEMVQLSGKVEKIRMSPSQVQTFKTLSGVRLNISNGGAVNLIVNGKDMGVPGDLGKPKRVSF
jgi:cytoskeleton protein RodZ